MLQQTTAKNPYEKYPDLGKEVEKIYEEQAKTYKGNFDEYSESVWEQDIYSTILEEKLPKEMWKSMEKYWEYIGEEPDDNSIRLAHMAERHVFGKIVEDEL